MSSSTSWPCFTSGSLTRRSWSRWRRTSWWITTRRRSLRTASQVSPTFRLRSGGAGGDLCHGCNPALFSTAASERLTQEQADDLMAWMKNALGPRVTNIKVTAGMVSTLGNKDWKAPKKSLSMNIRCLACCHLTTKLNGFYYSIYVKKKEYTFLVWNKTSANIFVGPLLALCPCGITGLYSHHYAWWEHEISSCSVPPPKLVGFSTHLPILMMHRRVFNPDVVISVNSFDDFPWCVPVMLNVDTVAGCCTVLNWNHNSTNVIFFVTLSWLLVSTLIPPWSRCWKWARPATSSEPSS